MASGIRCLVRGKSNHSSQLTHVQTSHCHDQGTLLTWNEQQELCQRMQYIAAAYTGAVKVRMESAAANCRAPYFDWAVLPSASGGSMLPASIGDSPKINVSGPHGTQMIANPLFAYAFKPPNREVFQDVAPVSVIIV